MALSTGDSGWYILASSPGGRLGCDSARGLSPNHRLGSSGGFSRDSSSDLLMSEGTRKEGGSKATGVTLQGPERKAGDSLSIRQISATALKTTLEKLTVILMVFMLGSCSSSGLCCGV
ncbi:hypothetical protein EYF80_053923 [Liparis tanakae]|uniref:Uncharacterized protein n=1 Tax=Liparis tanakae TaxID=230148 RepID=A0A4Z2F3V5_9TELE|nr:hypothetical protein EYF80_053923 [Liparis tanakae]